MILTLSAGGLGLCAGWEATAEARMACCVKGAACPMHTADDSGTRQVVSQAVADACCAASERGDAAPSDAAYVPLATLLPAVSPIALALVPIDVPIDAWSADVPAPGLHVATHLLLSVLLI